ncbi:MAG: phasin family protein [Xanthobacteraceae bacterium]
MANENVENFVEQSMDRTKAAMDQYFDFVQNAFSSLPMTSPELTDKIKEFTEENIRTSREFVKQLGQAKDFLDVVRIQTEYMQRQFNAFAEQSKSLTESFTKAASSVQNPLEPLLYRRV